MNPIQRVVKFLATVFAVILAVSIVSAIIGSILGALGVIIPGQKDGGDGSNLISQDYCFDDVSELAIESDVADIQVVASTDKQEESVIVKLDLVDESHEVTLQDGRLKIESDKRTNVLSALGDVFEGDETVQGVIRVIVPSEHHIESADFESGYGRIEVKGLHSERLRISANTGNVVCERVAAKKFKGETEIGSASFKGCRFTDAEIMGGAEDFTFEGMLLGSCWVKGNIGRMEFNLSMKPDDCELNITDGLGNVYIDGHKYVKEEYQKPKADNRISVDVGVGNINFNFE